MFLYSEIFDILRREKITGLQDIYKIAHIHPGRNVGYLEAGEHPWLRPVYRLVFRNYQTLLDQHKNQSFPHLLVRKPIPYGKKTSYLEDEKNVSLISKYSCIFPSKILFICNQFIYYGEDNKDYMIPVDFFVLLFYLKPMLEAGLAYLLPSRLKDSRWGFPRTIISTYDYLETNKPIEIPSFGYGHRLGLEKNIDDPSKTLMFEMPWLLGVRLEDYVELAQNNAEIFQIYARSVGQFFRNDITSSGNVSEWVKELSYSTKELDVLYKNKKQELSRKGMDVAIGATVTVGSLFLPSTMEPIKNVLAATFGSKSILESITWLREYQTAKDTLNNEKGWILWKLKH